MTEPATPTRALPVGVLVSGSGSNLEAIFIAIESGELPAEVRIVVSNKPGVLALERAAKRGVKTVVLDHKSFATREAFDTGVVHVLREAGVELVVLAGFMRIVTSVLLDAFTDRVLNVHPALLPAFPGAHGARDAIAHGVKISGCTVHLVDGGVDTGPIVAQVAVPVLEEDDEAALQKRIQAEEHQILPRAIRWFAENRVRIVREGSDRVRARAIVLALASSFILVLPACDNKAKNEARILASTIDRYRDGSLEERPERAQRVAGLACSHPVTCATKEACLRTIVPFIEGLELRAKAKSDSAKLVDGGGDIADFQALDNVLARASERVATAEAMRQGCEQALEEQKKTFGY